MCVSNVINTLYISHTNRYMYVHSRNLPTRLRKAKKLIAKFNPFVHMYMMFPESALSVTRVRLQRYSIPGQTLPESGSTAAPPLTFILTCDGILFVNIISVITIEKNMMHCALDAIELGGLSRVSADTLSYILVYLLVHVHVQCEKNLHLSMA